MNFVADQFHPDKPYPEHAWCHGPGQFYAATPRGSIRISQSDWIVTFENGDRVVVGDPTFHAFFEPMMDKPMPGLRGPLGQRVEPPKEPEQLSSKDTPGPPDMEPAKPAEEMPQAKDESKDAKELSPKKDTPEDKADDSSKGGKSKQSDAVAGKDSESGKPGDSKERP